MKLKIGLAGASQLSFPGDKPALFNASVEYMQGLSEKLDFELCVYGPLQRAMHEGRGDKRDVSAVLSA